MNERTQYAGIPFVAARGTTLEHIVAALALRMEEGENRLVIIVEGGAYPVTLELHALEVDGEPTPQVIIVDASLLKPFGDLTVEPGKLLKP